MPVTKHKLTTHADNITGDAGADMFIGALTKGGPTLNSNDHLNGGKGIDTVKAALIEAGIAPIMKNIENGIFTTGSVGDATLDLAAAAQMQNLTFAESAAHPVLTSVHVEDADHVSSISVKGTTDNFYSFSNLADVKHRSMHLSFEGTADTSMELVAGNHDVFKHLDIALSGDADIMLSGNSIAASNLTISSTAAVTQNQLTFSPEMNTRNVQHLTVTGSANLNLVQPTEAFEHLRSFDATQKSGFTWAQIGGQHLQTVEGGAGSEVLAITAMGGTAAAPGEVNLGGGADYLTLKFSGLEAATHHYNGGKGFDELTFTGSGEGLQDAVKNFESIAVNDATGSYDLDHMKITNFMLNSVATILTVDDINSGATLVIYQDSPTFMTVNVADAATSDTESLRVLLQNSATLGSTVAGFSAPDLSDLEIASYSGDHTMYLGEIGGSDNPTSIDITGDHHLTLNASNASTSFIAYLSIDNAAGTDISGLAAGNKVFVDTGATVVGGDGDDVLVGGDGDDHISTGGGDNTVIGSLGADAVMLTLNSGQDTLVFNDKAQSSYGVGHDTVANFGIFDSIDLSALGVAISFVGNAANSSDGMALLSSAHASAFFSQADHVLYIDLNHDQQFTAAADMEITLGGVSSFNAGQLLS